MCKQKMPQPWIVLLWLATGTLAKGKSQQQLSFDDTASVEENIAQLNVLVVSSMGSVLGDVVGVPTWLWPPARGFEAAPDGVEAPAEDIVQQLIDADRMSGVQKQKDVLMRISTASGLGDPFAVIDDTDSATATSEDSTHYRSVNGDSPEWEPLVSPKLERNPILLAKDIEEQIQLHDAEMNKQMANMLPHVGQTIEASIQFSGLSGEQISFGSVPFYGPFANEAVLALSFANQHSSLLHGLDPREALELTRFGTDPDKWGDALTDAIECSEHPYHTPALSSLGGDVAEWVLALHIYEELLTGAIVDNGEMRQDNVDTPINLSPSDVYRVLVDYLSTSSKKGFHICVSAEFLSGVCSRTHFCPISAQSLLSPPDDMVTDIISQLGFSNTLPSRQLFAMFNYAEDYETKPTLIAGAVRAVFALLWNIPLDSKANSFSVQKARAKLQLTVTREQSLQSAVVSVHTHSYCPTSVYPKMATVANSQKGSRSALVLFPEALNAYRAHLALFFNQRSDEIGGMESPAARENISPIFRNLPPATKAAEAVFLEVSSGQFNDEESEEQNDVFEFDEQPQTAFGGADVEPLSTEGMFEEAEENDDATGQKQSRVQLPTQTGAARRVAMAESSQSQRSPQQRALAVSFRLRKLGWKHLLLSLNTYMSNLPMYNVIFTPTSSMDPCSFKAPFNQPFVSEGPWIEQSRNASSFDTKSRRHPIVALSPAASFQSEIQSNVLASLRPGMSFQKISGVVDGILDSWVSTQPQIRSDGTAVNKPIAFEWVRLRFVSLAAMDGRVRQPVVAAPGADVGQFILALAVFERASKRHLSQHEVDTLLHGLLQTVERPTFSLWTDSEAIDHLCHISSACPVLDPRFDDQLLTTEQRLEKVLESLRLPSSDSLARLREAVAQPEANGDLFLRWLLLGKGKDFGVRAELAGIAIRSFFGIMWNFLPDHITPPMTQLEHSRLRAKLDWAVMSGPEGDEGALLTVIGGPGCQNTIQPAVSESFEGQKMFVYHTTAAQLVREHFLEYILSHHPSLQPSFAALRLSSDTLAEQAIEAHLNFLLKGKSRYAAEISGPECLRR